MSLRSRAVVLVSLTNAAAFAVLGALTYDESRAAEAREREASVNVAKELTSVLAPLLDDALRSSDPNAPGLDLERVLSWPHWSRMRDAVLLDSNAIRLELGGPVAAAGLLVNPLGVEHRDPDFDLGLAKRAVEQAMREGGAVDDGRGMAVPVMSGGELRGGAYFVFREPRVGGKLPIGLWSLFFASTVGLTGIVSFYITRSILRPIENLAGVSRRIRDGDLTAVPAPQTSDDEIADLTRSVSAMLQALRHHREELERECALAADRAKRAEHELLTAQRLASLGTLAAGIAHEINNPLGGMQNALRQLEGGSLTPERRREYFELVRDGLGRVEGIVKRALAIAPKGLTAGPLRVSDALHDARVLIDHRLVKENAAFVLVPLTEDDWIKASKGEVIQLFLNLFINALDALGEFAARSTPVAAGWTPTIECVVARERDWIRVEVRDNGGGARPEDLDRLFDPFFTTKEPGKGSGLGLAVAYGIVRNHGGRIQASNRESGGFQVRVDFPCLDAKQPATEKT